MGVERGKNRHERQSDGLDRVTERIKGERERETTELEDR
jgi:hypothetical protein